MRSDGVLSLRGLRPQGHDLQIAVVLGVFSFRVLNDWVTEIEISCCLLLRFVHKLVSQVCLPTLSLCLTARSMWFRGKLLPHKF